MPMKVVDQIILTYFMSKFKFPKELCDEMQSLTSIFWWGHANDLKKIHLVGRDRLCKSKLDRGLGFRNFGRV